MPKKILNDLYSLLNDIKDYFEIEQKVNETSELILSDYQIESKLYDDAQIEYNSSNKISESKKKTKIIVILIMLVCACIEISMKSIGGAIIVIVFGCLILKFALKKIEKNVRKKAVDNYDKVEGRKKYDQENEKLQNQINDYKTQQDELLEKISNNKTVPNEYKEIEPLQIMIDSIEGMKADTIKEALIRCDYELEKRERQKREQEFLENQKNLMRENQRLQNQLLSQQDQINRQSAENQRQLQDLNEKFDKRFGNSY